MPIKILVVDDEPKLATLIRQLFRRQIRKKKFVFTFAQNGEDALNQLQANPDIDLVLTDINMPKMDGLTLLTRLKELKVDLSPGLTAVIISAYGDMENIRKAMNGGAFDFITKPLDLKDLKLTIEKTIEHSLLLKKAIEEKKQAEEALHRANQELEHRVLQRTVDLSRANHSLKTMNSELDAFSRMVTHDLKNPIASVIMCSSTIMEYFKELEEEELLEFVGLIHNSGHKAQTIIDELLLLARVRKATVSLEPLDMKQIMTQVRNHLLLMIEQYKATLIVPDSWPQAVGHAPWVEQVWFNYLSNAIKYGGSPPQIEVGATKIDHHTIRFWIRDNGPGIPAQAQASLFTEFTRLGEQKVEGSGLGLSIVKRIIEKLGGKVGVKSQLGSGSEFYFTLPSAV